MTLKVLNAIGWILFWGKLVFAFGPAVWFVIALGPSAASLGCAVGWIWCVLLTKPAGKWQKW